MTIIYSDGRRVSGVVLSEYSDVVRVALEGTGDASTFTLHNGVWIDEECEPVRIEYAWQRPQEQQAVPESDCICSKDLAARLIHLLWSGDEEITLTFRMPAVVSAPAGHRVF